MTRNEIIQYIRQQAVANGVDPDTLVAFANLESNFKLGEKSDKSSAGGVFQFTKDAWKDFGNPQGSKFNLADNTAAAIKFLQHNTDVLQRNGFEASPPNLYVRHFLGSTGGMKFLKAHSKDG